MNDEGLSCSETQGLLSYLVGALVTYREEGTELNPTILICDSIHEVLEGIPGSSSYEIGNTELNRNSGSRILKECGILAIEPWFIYIERTASSLKFGVAAYPVGPQSITLLEALPLRSNGVTIAVRRSAQSTVEVLGSKGSDLALVFSTSRETQSETAKQAVDRFSSKCCTSLRNPANSEPFQKYFSNLLLRAIENSHGSIMACIRSGAIESISEIRELVALSPALDFFKAFVEHRVSLGAETLLKLQSLERLLWGLVQADGIVIFSDSGCVTAYRAFFRPAADSPIETVVGGARRRAFEGIIRRIGEDFPAALFRSQDGLTICRCNDD
ncbi:MAG: hypothetical protein KF811_00500 [Dokdonella sp.]|nr:hypothetical protein [Dokdonella sp.]